VRLLRPLGLLWYRLLAATVLLLALGLAARFALPALPLARPLIESATPPQGARDVSSASQMSLRFDQPMNTASVERALRVSPNVAGATRWSDDRRTLTFLPSEPLTPGVDYRLSLDTTAQGWLFRTLERPFELAFRTAPAPTITSLLPPEGASGIRTDAPLSIRFSRPMVPAELVGRELIVPELLIEPPADLASAWIDQATLLLRPRPTLTPATPYTITLAASLRDLTGNPLGAPLYWHLSTEVPRIVAFSPPDGARNVGLRQPLVISLSQQLDPAALSAALLITPSLAGQIDIASPPGAQELGVAQVVTFTPRLGWAPSQAYSATLAAGVAPAQGSLPLPAVPNWGFVSAEQPRIIARFPGEGQTLPPAQDVRLVFNTPINVSAISTSLQIDPPLPTLSVRGAGSEIRIGGELAPATAYTLTLPATLRDLSGVALGKEYRLRFVTAPASPSLRLPDAAGHILTLPADQDHQLRFERLRLSAANLSLYRLDEATLLRTFGFAEEDWRAFAPERYGLSEQARLALSFADPDDTAVPDLVNLSLRDDLPRLDPGAYFLRVASDAGPQADLVVIVSRFVLTLKSGARESLIWATDVISRTPAAGLPLTLYQGDSVVARGRSDDQGLWRVAQGVAAGSAPFLAIAGDLEGVVSGDWRVGEGPVAQLARQRPPRYQGLLYSDRAAYQPGDEVQVGLLAREVEGAQARLPGDAALFELSVRPSAGPIFYQAKLLPRRGFDEASFQLPSDAAPGRYLLLATHGDTRVEASFEVVAPESSLLRVELTAPAQAQAGTTLPLSATVRSLEGLPLSGVALSWTLNCPAAQASQPCPRLAGAGTSDPAGLFGFDLPLPPDAPGRYQLDLRALELPGVEGLARATLDVLPALRLEARLRARLLGAGEPIEIDALALDSNAQPSPGQTVEAELLRLSQPNTEGVPATSELLRRRAVSAGDGRAALTLPGQAPGSYRLVLRVAGLPGSSVELPLTITREGFADWPQAPGQAQLIADRALYRPGETATLLPQLPFAPGAALLLRERAGSLTAEPVELRTGLPITLTLDADDAPGLFVALLSLPAPGEPALLLSSYTWLAVEPEAAQLSISSDRASYQPGETATLTLTFRDSAGLPLAGELTLIGSELPNLASEAAVRLREAPYPPGIGTAHGLARNEAAYQAASPWPRSPEPAFLPETPEPVLVADAPKLPAVWQSGLRTGPNGELSLQLRLPDAEGRLDVRVLGIDAQGRVGQGSLRLGLAAPLRIEPRLPIAPQVGDEIELAARVSNSDTISHEVAVTLAVAGVVPTSGSSLTRHLTLEPGQSDVLVWTGSVGGGDSALIGFDALLESGQVVRSETRLPIRPSLRRTLLSGGGVAAPRFSSGQLDMQPGAGPSELELVVAPSLGAALRDQWLRLRAEEARSVLLDADALAAAQALNAVELARPDESDLLVDRLVEAQNVEGGWGWWPESPPDPFISARVVLALSAAPEGSVPARTHEGARRFLRRALSSLDDPNLRAFVLAALAKLEQPDAALAQQLGADLAALDNEALSVLALALHDAGADTSELLDTLRARVQRAEGLAFWLGAPTLNRPSNEVLATALALRALKLLDPGSPLLAEARAFLLARYQSDGWGDSHANAQVIETLAERSREPAQAYRYVLAVNGVELLARSVSSALSTTERLTLGAADLRPRNELTLTRDGSGSELLVGYRLRAARAGAPGGAFALQRAFYNPRDGSLLDPTALHAGALVEVRLTLVTPQARGYVVLEEPLPGLFALLAPSRGQTSFEATHVSERVLRLYARALEPGIYEQRYLARVVAAGTFVAPPPLAYPMFEPSTVGLGSAEQLVAGP
jgi:hypothetical protein